jgi:hypothetical protein
MLARELSIANDEAHRAAKAYNERHHRADATVAYNAERVHVDFMNGASVRHNWKLACACLDNIRRYYSVVPPKHFLPYGFGDAKEPHIEACMRKWDDEIAQKELARAEASAARARRTRNGRARRKAWNAEARTQDEENSRARKRAWEQRGLSLVSQTQDEENSRRRQYAWKKRGLSLHPSD